MADKGKKTLNDLLDPSYNLSGRDLRRVARALTRIETRPLINAYRRQARRYRRDMRRDMRGYERLRKTTKRSVAGAHNSFDRMLDQAGQAAQNQGLALQANVRQNSQAAQNTLNQTQSGVLGQQLDHLGAANVESGLAEGALANQMAAQQVRQASESSDWQNLAAQVAAGNRQTIGNQRRSNIMARTEAMTGINNSIMARKGQARADYGEARREVLGKLADQKALIGPTRLKNLMDLRDAERTNMNEKAAMALDRAEYAEDVRHNKAGEAQDAADEQGRNDRDDDGSGSGGGSDDATYRDFFQAAQAIRTEDGARPGNDIRPNSDFFDQVARSEGLSLNPRQRRAWARKYRQWLRKNGLLG